MWIAQRGAHVASQPSLPPSLPLGERGLRDGDERALNLVDSDAKLPQGARRLPPSGEPVDEVAEEEAKKEKY